MELRTTERLFWSYRKHKANGSRKGRGKKGVRGKGEGCEGKGVGLDDELGGSGCGWDVVRTRELVYKSYGVQNYL